MAGEVGENPTLTRNRELVMASRITTTVDHFRFLTTRRGLRGGELFRHRELVSIERFTMNVSSHRLNAKKFFTIVATLLLCSATLTPAHAESGYRYWGYFQAAKDATSWTAAMTGPSVALNDGAVEGWVFTASGNDTPANPPMMDPNFNELCSATSAVADKIRVGLVVDFGSGDIAPQGETPKEFFSDCVVVPKGSNGLAVLQSAFDVRTDKSGLICGIAGYPKSECGAQIELPAENPFPIASPLIAPAPEEASEKSQLPVALLATFAVIIAAIVLRRRRRS